jgi:glutathione S-transferase
MALELYFHPLASFCWKVLIPLYENETPFEPLVVDLADETSRTDFEKIWPIGKFPVLRETATGRVVPESTSIIEYLGLHHPGKVELVPRDPERALEVRWLDRFFDHYVHEPMQKVVTDRIRPAGQNDPYGVEQAKRTIGTAYGMIERDMRAKTWAAGDAFTLADCAASPALHYANRVVPFGDAHPNVASYLRRLEERPSFARVLREAQPYFVHFPG